MAQPESHMDRTQRALDHADLNELRGQGIQEGQADKIQSGTDPALAATEEVDPGSDQASCTQAVTSTTPQETTAIGLDEETETPEAMTEDSADTIDLSTDEIDDLAGDNVDMSDTLDEPVIEEELSVEAGEDFDPDDCKPADGTSEAGLKDEDAVQGAEPEPASVTEEPAADGAFDVDAGSTGTELSDAVEPNSDVDEGHVNATEADGMLSEEPVADASDLDNEPETEAFEQSASSDLRCLPGAGPSLVWMLNQCGIQSLADLASADPRQLSTDLGVIGQILDVQKWIVFAQETKGNEAA